MCNSKNVTVFSVNGGILRGMEYFATWTGSVTSFTEVMRLYVNFLHVTWLGSMILFYGQMPPLRKVDTQWKFLKTEWEYLLKFCQQNKNKLSYRFTEDREQRRTKGKRGLLSSLFLVWKCGINAYTGENLNPNNLFCIEIFRTRPFGIPLAFLLWSSEFSVWK